jgi:HEAT repeat protein
VPKTHHFGFGPASGTHASFEADPTARLRTVAVSRDAGTLARALRDSSPDVARAAIRRVLELDGVWAAPVLRAVLFDADTAIVADLAKALRDHNDPETLELARGSLNDERYTHRLTGAVTLGIAGDASVRPDLRRALGDPIAAVRAAALEALTRLGRDQQSVSGAVALLTDASPQVRVGAVRLVAGSDPQPAKLLAAAVKDGAMEVRCELARHIGKLADADARLLLADPDEGVRCQAARCAGSQHTITLGRLLSDDRRADVRRAAARALGGIGGQAAGEALLAGIEDHDAVVRSRVLHALEQALSRQGAIARLAGELHSARAQRRRCSLYALAQLGDCDHADLLWGLADDPDLDVRVAVLVTANAFLSEPEPLLMYMRTDPNVEVREIAERRLAGYSS